MCGGLVVLAPGSPYQILGAILIMQFHLLVVLKLAPFIKDSEDWSSFVSTLGLFAMSLGAYSMMLQADEKELHRIGVVLAGISIFCITIVVAIMIFVDCGLWNCMRCQKCSKRVQKKNESTGSLTQVRPIGDDNNYRSDQHTKLRNTRLKYGADSEEYKMEVKNVQNTEKEKENKN